METGAKETLRHRGGGGGGGKRKCRREAAAGCCRQLPTDLSSGTCRSRAMSFYAFLFPSRRRFAESKNYCRLSFVRAIRSLPPPSLRKTPFLFFLLLLLCRPVNWILANWILVYVYRGGGGGDCFNVNYRLRKFYFREKDDLDIRYFLWGGRFFF